MESARRVTPQALWEELRVDWVGREEIGEPGSRSVGERWREAVKERLRQLHKETARLGLNQSVRRFVLIAEPDPIEFIAAFLAALLAEWDIALANPNWGNQEWNAVEQLLWPQIVWGKNAPIQSSLKEMQQSVSNRGDNSPPKILIPTGGSSGQVKFVCHSWQSLTASAYGFLQYFSPNATPISTYCVLPLYHVSGLMQVLRTWLSGGQIILTSFKALKTLFSSPHSENKLPLFLSPVSSLHISLVPTQLQYLIQANAAAWLRQFHAVLLGGAPPWPALIERAVAEQISVYPSYGMTETAAMVTLLPLKDCLQGDLLEAEPHHQNSGQPMPHAAVEILAGDRIMPPGKVGQVVVRSPAVAQGYYGLESTAFTSKNCASNTFRTDDLGYLSTDGHLHIVGRASSKIISGGENIFPAEVESAIRSTQQVTDVCVVGIPDTYWGEAVVAVYVAKDSAVSVQSLKQALLNSYQEQGSPLKLSRYKHPKHWVALKTLPRNAQGKLNRQQLLARLKDLQIAQPNFADPGLESGGGDRTY